MDIRPIDANALVEKLQNINPVDYGAMSSYETHNGARDALSDAVMYVNDASTLTLNTQRDAIYEDAVAHGLWEDADKAADELAADYPEDIRPGERLMFLRMEAARSVYFEADELLSASEANNAAGFVEELADVVIMCFSVAGKLGIDIDAAIRRKMEINKKRPWKHGKE